MGAKFVVRKASSESSRPPVQPIVVQASPREKFPVRGNTRRGLVGAGVQLGHQSPQKILYQTPRLEGGSCLSSPAFPALQSASCVSLGGPSMVGAGRLTTSCG